MTRMNVIADALKSIVNAETRGQKQVLLRPTSKVLVHILRLMQKKGYLGQIEIIDDGRNGKIVVNLLGRLNKCGVISPRYDITLEELPKLSDRLLPSRQFGYVVLTTSKGIMDHVQAQKLGQSGKVLGFFF